MTYSRRGASSPKFVFSDRTGPRAVHQVLSSFAVDSLEIHTRIARILQLFNGGYNQESQKVLILHG